MSVIRLTKEFGFEASHALDHYPGGCRNLHGHSYKLIVTVKGRINPVATHYQDAIVMDFKELKSIVHAEVIAHMDHCAILQEGGVHAHLLQNHPDAGRILWVPFSPTCEAMLVYIVQKIQRALPEHIQVEEVTLFETATSSATWHANDQS